MKLFENREYLGSKSDSLSFLNLNNAHKIVARKNDAVPAGTKNPMFSNKIPRTVKLHGGDACTVLRTLPVQPAN